MYEKINQNCKTDYCTGYKSCNLFIKQYDSKDKDCHECFKDAMIGIQQSIISAFGTAPDLVKPSPVPPSAATTINFHFIKFVRAF